MNVAYDLIKNKNILSINNDYKNNFITNQSGDDSGRTLLLKVETNPPRGFVTGEWNQVNSDVVMSEVKEWIFSRAARWFHLSKLKAAVKYTFITIKYHCWGPEKVAVDNNTCATELQAELIS